MLPGVFFAKPLDSCRTPAKTKDFARRVPK